MTDKIETIGYGTVIQHGKLNDRIYLQKLDRRDASEIIERLFSLAKDNSYSKLFCKVPDWAVPIFISNGFMQEAHIPNFYNGLVDVFFMSKFLNEERYLKRENDQLSVLTNLLFSNTSEIKIVNISPDFVFHALGLEDAEEISALYKVVFESYPFPIFDPNYIKQTMQDNVQYFGYRHNGKLVALSSAEMDKKGQNVEMTDFATLPDFRANKLALALLGRMEQEMKKQGVITLYTIARLNSPAMNKTFLNMNYKYAGTLINNTNISGKIESMNIHYKHI
jgi:putative beta-lysine N-acetyltransferase